MGTRDFIHVSYKEKPEYKGSKVEILQRTVPSSAERGSRKLRGLDRKALLEGSLDFIQRAQEPLEDLKENNRIITTLLTQDDCVTTTGSK